MITPELKEHFEIQGYLNIKGMFSKAEARLCGSITWSCACKAANRAILLE